MNLYCSSCNHADKIICVKTIQIICVIYLRKKTCDYASCNLVSLQVDFQYSFMWLQAWREDTILTFCFLEDFFTFTRYFTRGNIIWILLYFSSILVSVGFTLFLDIKLYWYQVIIIIKIYHFHYLFEFRKLLQSIVW